MIIFCTEFPFFKCCSFSGRSWCEEFFFVLVHLRHNWSHHFRRANSYWCFHLLKVRLSLNSGNIGKECRLASAQFILKEFFYLRNSLSDLEVYKFADKKASNQDSVALVTSDSNSNLEEFPNVMVLEPRRDFVPSPPVQLLGTMGCISVPKLIFVQERKNCST